MKDEGTSQAHAAFPVFILHTSSFILPLNFTPSAFSFAAGHFFFPCPRSSLALCGAWCMVGSRASRSIGLRASCSYGAPVRARAWEETRHAQDCSNSGHAGAGRGGDRPEHDAVSDGLADGRAAVAFFAAGGSGTSVRCGAFGRICAGAHFGQGIGAEVVSGNAACRRNTATSHDDAAREFARDERYSDCGNPSATDGRGSRIVRRTVGRISPAARRQWDGGGRSRCTARRNRTEQHAASRRVAAAGRHEQGVAGRGGRIAAGRR